MPISTKTLTVRDNVVLSNLSNPLINRRCGWVNYFNNKSSAGLLLQGANADLSNRKYDELATLADDALLVAYMNER